MRRTNACVWVLLPALVFAAPALKEKPKAPPIVGEWQRIGHLQAGENRFTPQEDHRQIFKADGEWQYYYGKGAGTKGMTYVTDPTQKLPTVDIRQNAMGTSGWRGVYKIEGDTLTLCLVSIQAERPQSFASNADNPTTIWVFKRIKPSE